ncbi:MAG: DUF6562 domain-containing protein [Candidatus Egerieousia sp.]|nr:DUF6562 domain-containing protein [Candidatus Egerieousia sp.]
MRSCFYALALVALCASALSCSKEEGVEYAECSIGVTLEAEAKSGEGTEAERVRYFVYEVVGENWSLLPSLTGEKALEVSGTTSISLRLVKDKAYAIAFWADFAPEGSSAELYRVDASAATISINSACATANNAKADAFFGATNLIGSAGSISVTLKRVLAKVNIVVAAILSGAEKSTATVSGVATTFSFRENEVTSTRGSIEYKAASCTSLPDVITSSRTLLSLHTFAPAATENASLTFKVLNSAGTAIVGKSVPALPLKRNTITNVQYTAPL